MTPFTRKSCPKNALWMYGLHWHTVASYNIEGITLNIGDFKSWKQLSENWRYSLDGGETWHPAYTP